MQSNPPRLNLFFMTALLGTCAFICTIALSQNEMFEETELRARTSSRVPTVRVALASGKPLAPYRGGIQVLKWERIPLVYVAIGMDCRRWVDRVIFHCRLGNAVVILTDEDQGNAMASTCAEVVHVSKFSPRRMLAWPPGARLSEKVFFDRYFVLQSWMEWSGTYQALYIDADNLVSVDVTDFVRRREAHFAERDVWIYYRAPRTSLCWCLATVHAMRDITDFWLQLFGSGVWLPGLIPGPITDMRAMGQYAAAAHLSAGLPYPCWDEKLPDNCDHEYATHKVLDRVKASGLVARFIPGPLNLWSEGIPPGGIDAVVDNNIFNRDRGFAMEEWLFYRQKTIRYENGVPFFKRSDARTGGWQRMLGFILEDGLEGTFPNHIALITGNATCQCGGPSCIVCT